MEQSTTSNVLDYFLLCENTWENGETHANIYSKETLCVNNNESLDNIVTIEEDVYSQEEQDIIVDDMELETVEKESCIKESLTVNRILYISEEHDEEVDVDGLDAEPLIDIMSINDEDVSTLLYAQNDTYESQGKTVFLSQHVGNLTSQVNNLSQHVAMNNYKASAELTKKIGQKDGYRESHNVLERLRRCNLMKSFQELRKCIPDMKSKTSKVTILSSALEYINVLTDENGLQINSIKKLQEENVALLRKWETLHGVIPYMR